MEFLIAPSFPFDSTNMKCAFLVLFYVRCNKRCHADCGPCMAVVGKTMPGCGHQQNLRCSEDPADFNCLAPCPKILRLCGHPCANRCSEVCTVKCEHLVKKTWPCGHKNKTKCHVDPLLTPCKAPCGAQLQCEHQCQGESHFEEFDFPSCY